MAIEIEYEKIVNRMTPSVKILSIKALTVEQLPKEYIFGVPCAKMYADYISSEQFIEVIVMLHNKYTKYTLEAGEIYTKDYFNRALAAISASGDRLKEINDRLRKDLANWKCEKKVAII